MQAFADFMDSWFGRLVRAGVSTGVAALVAKYKGNPLYISLVPILQAASKFLRDKFPNSLWEILPF